MPSRDHRLNPALERALPGDSLPAYVTQYRDLSEPRRVLFGDGKWHQVQIIATWLDRFCRRVLECAWYTDGEAYQESYLFSRQAVLKRGRLFVPSRSHAVFSGHGYWQQAVVTKTPPASRGER